MLPEPSVPAWAEIDVEVFDCLVKPDHYVRRVLELMDFERFRPILARYYSPDQGRPAEDPVRMVKLEFLQYRDTLSDRQVVDRAETDVAYRWFLGLGLDDELPHPTSLCVFRGRIGVEGHRAIFNELIAQAREHGLVRDRLRLKDATHLIADVAIPSTLALIAQVRNKLLRAVEPFDALRAEGERARTEMIHTSTGRGAFGGSGDSLARDPGMGGRIGLARGGGSEPRLANVGGDPGVGPQDPG